MSPPPWHLLHDSMASQQRQQATHFLPICMWEQGTMCGPVAPLCQLCPPTSAAHHHVQAHALSKPSPDTRWLGSMHLRKALISAVHSSSTSWSVLLKQPGHLHTVVAWHGAHTMSPSMAFGPPPVLLLPALLPAWLLHALGPSGTCFGSFISSQAMIVRSSLYLTPVNTFTLFRAAAGRLMHKQQRQYALGNVAAKAQYPCHATPHACRPHATCNNQHCCAAATLGVNCPLLLHPPVDHAAGVGLEEQAGPGVSVKVQHAHVADVQGALDPLHSRMEGKCSRSW